MPFISMRAAKEVACHERRLSKHQWYLELDHYLGQLSKKPGALPHSLALAQGTDWLRELFENHFRTRPADFIESLRVKKQTNSSEQDFKAAVLSCLTTSSNSPVDASMVKLLLCQQGKPAVSYIASEDEFSQALMEGCAKQLAAQQQLMYTIYKQS